MIEEEESVLKYFKHWWPYELHNTAVDLENEHGRLSLRNKHGKG